jgi:hypothetical protein
MVAVQFSPGVKHTVTEEEVMGTLGDGAGGTGAGEDARRGFPARQNWLSGQ